MASALQGGGLLGRAGGGCLTRQDHLRDPPRDAVVAAAIEAVLKMPV